MTDCQKLSVLLFEGVCRPSSNKPDCMAAMFDETGSSLTQYGREASINQVLWPRGKHEPSYMVRGQA